MADNAGENIAHKRLERMIADRLDATHEGLEVDKLIDEIAVEAGEGRSVIQRVIWHLIDTRRVIIDWETRLQNNTALSSRPRARAT